MARMQERHGGDGRSWLADDAARRRKISGRGNTSEAPGGALATDGVAWRSGMDAWRACKAEGVDVRPRGPGVVSVGLAYWRKKITLWDQLSAGEAKRKRSGKLIKC